MAFLSSPAPLRPPRCRRGVPLPQYEVIEPTESLPSRRPRREVERGAGADAERSGFFISAFFHSRPRPGFHRQGGTVDHRPTFRGARFGGRPRGAGGARRNERGVAPFENAGGRRGRGGRGDGGGAGGGRGGGGGGDDGASWGDGTGDGAAAAAVPWPPPRETLADIVLTSFGTAYAFAWMALDRFQDIDVEAAPAAVQVLYGLLNLLQFVGVARVARLCHPYAAAAARALAPGPLPEDFQLGIEYAATLLALVYAALLGGVFGDRSGSIRRESSHREAGNLYTVVLQGSLMNGGGDAAAKRGVLASVHEYVTCLLAVDFGRQATQCSRCMGVLSRVERRLMALADDGTKDKIDLVNLSTLLATIREAQESRSVRIAAFDPHMTWMLAGRIRLLAGLLAGGFLYRTSGSARLDALLWGNMLAVFVKLDQLYEDIAEWTRGEYKITPIAFEQLRETLEGEMRALEMETPTAEEYGFVPRRVVREVPLPVVMD
eukprot:tig00001073_g6829.t1